MTGVSTSGGMSNLNATYYGGGKSVLGNKKRKKVTKTSRAKSKIKKTMDEWKSGKLHSGSKKGPVVKNQKQAVAIALNQARKEK